MPLSQPIAISPQLRSCATASAPSFTPNGSSTTAKPYVRRGVETWAKATRELLAASKSEQDPQSMTTSIDQAYTSAVAALDEQRSFMKRLISATQSN